jgi:aspartate/methionine/tyrosine aminotransferase
MLMYTHEQCRSLVQYGAIGALEAPASCPSRPTATSCGRITNLFFEGITTAAPGILTGTRDAALYTFSASTPTGHTTPASGASRSPWRPVAEHLIRSARIGCVPGVDFGAASEGYLRFCTCRSREELTGALASMRALLTGPTQA